MTFSHRLIIRESTVYPKASTNARVGPLHQGQQYCCVGSFSGKCDGRVNDTAPTTMRQPPTNVPKTVIHIRRWSLRLSDQSDLSPLSDLRWLVIARTVQPIADDGVACRPGACRLLYGRERATPSLGVHPLAVGHPPGSGLGPAGEGGAPHRLTDLRPRGQVC